MKHHLVNLYYVCSNYIPGAKNGPTPGHMLYIVLYREKHEKIFLSEPTLPRALIFVMKHHLVNLCQVCSNNIPGAKNGRLGGHMFHIGLYREHISPVENQNDLELDFKVFFFFY